MRPASRTPRRFPYASSTITSTETGIWRWSSRCRPDGRGDQCVRAGRHLDGDGDDVVDQQRHGGDLCDVRPEVLPGDHVGTAGPGVDRDDIAVGDRQKQQDQQDRTGHRHDQGEGGCSDDRHEDPEHLLGAVGRRTDAVGREHTERRPVAQLLLTDTFGRERLPEEPLLDAVRQPIKGHVPIETGRCSTTVQAQPAAAHPYPPGPLHSAGTAGRRPPRRPPGVELPALGRASSG